MKKPKRSATNSTPSLDLLFDRARQRSRGEILRLHEQKADDPVAVIYVRVSTDKQVDNTSLAAQEAACREYCARHEIRVERVFVEEGESAKTMDRPRLMEMLDYCAAHRDQISHLVVHSMSRLARNAQDEMLISIVLEHAGITVRAATEPFDDSSVGKFARKMLSLVAEFDNDQRAARTVEGMRAAATSGRWQYIAPLGYTKPPRGDRGPSLLVDEVPAALVRRAFDEMAKGDRHMADVLREINALGLRSRKGKPVSSQAFWKMLRNPVYAGIVRHECWGIDVEGDFEAIVDRATFERVQAVLDRVRGTPKRRSQQHPDFPLRQFVRCAHCGTPLTGSRSKGRGGQYRYYSCRHTACKNRVRGSVLEDEFRDHLRGLAVDPAVLELFDEIVVDAWADHVEDLDAQRETLQARLDALDDREDRLIDLRVEDRTMRDEAYQRQMKRIGRDRAEVEYQMTTLDATKPAVTDVLAFAKRLLGDPAGYWNASDLEGKTALQVAVYPDGVTFGPAGVGTGASSLIFSYLRQIPAAKARVAARRGIEPLFPP